MYFVYILISLKDKRLYVGCTKDIEKRLVLHNTGKVVSTRIRRPLVLLHLEEYEQKGKAFGRERFLKSLWSTRFKRKLRDNYLGRAKP